MFKDKRHVHVIGDYNNDIIVKYYKAGHYTCFVGNNLSNDNWRLQKYYHLSIYFHIDTWYYNTFTMKIHGNLKSFFLNMIIFEENSTRIDKEMMIQFENLQFKDSYKMILVSLKKIFYIRYTWFWLG